MKKIQFTQNKVALVDNEDFEELNKYKWHATKRGNRFYAARMSSRKSSKRKLILMHRIILNVASNLEVDHIDNNGLNNTRSNLRSATRADNSHNITNNKGFIPYKGIYLHKKSCRYFAAIKDKNKKYYLGGYDSAVCAALAYDKKAKELHGEFAQLNFSDSWFENS